ncbi:MAG: AmmeMemoRadiSam system radical SAM enzyme [Anaerolineae bacterium]|nr:AmmeMemoRadiSam system radical SAM enzyme [Anaerolineae bacterium]
MTFSSSQQATLQEVLDTATVEGELYEKLADDKVRCFACGHRCVIFPGRRGICQVRYNEGGVLRVPFGYAAGVQSDPVEKKPFFHAMPSSNALTFGMLGCDLQCGYCQNWVTSQALRDKAAGVAPTQVTAESLVQSAQRTEARLVVSSYNEPLITAEWAVEVFKQAKAVGLVTGFVSNGHGTPEVLTYLKPYTDCYKVDLKSMRQENYRELGGQLKHVLWTIEELYRRDFWLEVLTLLVPGFNDSTEELWETARFIAGVSPEIPWHVTAFHKNYKMTEPDNTTSAMLIRAVEIGVEAGLHYVYAGNRPGEVGNWENTYCPKCQTLLVERYGFVVLSYHLTDEGACPKCNHPIPGIWPRSAHKVQTGSPAAIFSRRPIRVRI